MCIRLMLGASMPLSHKHADELNGITFIIAVALLRHPHIMPLSLWDTVHWIFSLFCWQLLISGETKSLSRRDVKLRRNQMKWIHRKNSLFFSISSYAGNLVYIHTQLTDRNGICGRKRQRKIAFFLLRWGCANLSLPFSPSPQMSVQ